MRECLIGAHLDNVDHPPEESYRKLRLMRASVVGTLWTPGTRHRRDVYLRLDSLLGGPEYVVRVGPSTQTSPGAWIQDAKMALQEVPVGIISEHRVRLRVLNEVNLPEEGGWTPLQYAALLASVAGVWTATELVASPISLGFPGWQDWYAQFLRVFGATFSGAFPVARQAVNCYAHLATPENLAIFAASGVPIDVTELNTLGITPGPARARWIASTARDLARSGAAVRSQQVFITGGKSFGAWDERYILTEEEALVLGSDPGGRIEVEESVVDRIIDVSNNNGWIDWDAVARGQVGETHPVRAAVLKSSGDETSRNRFVDGDFAYNWKECKRVGLHHGAYHYAKPSRVKPSDSVTLLQEVIRTNGGFDRFDFYALDLEDPEVPIGVSLAQWTAEWLALAEEVFGFPGLLYTGNYYMAEHDLYHASLSRYPLWLASYQATVPPVPMGWDKITLWQNSDEASVPGVTGRCDSNVLLVPLADFLETVGCPTAATPPPAPPIDEVTDALNNVFDLSLHPGPNNEERRRSAQEAIVVLKRHLGVQ